MPDKREVSNYEADRLLYSVTQGLFDSQGEQTRDYLLPEGYVIALTPQGERLQQAIRQRLHRPIIITTSVALLLEDGPAVMMRNVMLNETSISTLKGIHARAKRSGVPAEEIKCVVQDPTKEVKERRLNANEMGHLRNAFNTAVTTKETTVGTQAATAYICMRIGRVITGFPLAAEEKAKIEEAYPAAKEARERAVMSLGYGESDKKADMAGAEVLKPVIEKIIAERSRGRGQEL